MTRRVIGDLPERRLEVALDLVGRHDDLSKPSATNVVWTDGGRWYRAEVTGRKSSTLMRIGATSPFHPTTSHGWNG